MTAPQIGLSEILRTRLLLLQLTLPVGWVTKSN